MKQANSYDDLGSIVYLNLEFVTLYGFENGNSDIVIDSIIKGIENGDEFPPVFVVRFPDNSYRIVAETDPLDDTNYGGHHRAIAHYIAGKPLKCLVIEDCYLENYQFKIKIENLTIAEKSLSLLMELKRTDRRYR